MPFGRALSWSNAHSRVSETRILETCAPAVARVADVLAVVVQDGGAAVGEAADAAFLEPFREVPPLLERAVDLGHAEAPAHPGAVLPAGSVGRSWPLIRFQAASRISSRNAAGHRSQLDPQP